MESDARGPMRGGDGFAGLTTAAGLPSRLPLDGDAAGEVPYDAEEIAEDCRWHELQRGTPFKDDLVHASTPIKELARLTSPSTAAAPQQPLTDDAVTPFKPRISAAPEDWPDTWTSVMSNVTPQRVGTGELLSQQMAVPLPPPSAVQFGQAHRQHHHRGSSAGWSTDQEDAAHRLIASSAELPRSSSHPGIMQAGGAAYAHHRHSASASTWSTDQEDADNEHEDPHDYHSQGHSALPQAFVPYMSRLSLDGDEPRLAGEYSPPSQHSSQPAHPHMSQLPPAQPVHAGPRYAQGFFPGHQAPPQVHSAPQTVPAASHGGYAQPAPPHFMQPAPSPSPPPSSHMQLQNMRIQPQSQTQPQGQPAAEFGFGGRSHHHTSHQRHPSPPPSAATFMAGNHANLSRLQALQQAPGMWMPGSGPPTGGSGASGQIPMLAMRGHGQLLPAATFAPHSTSGPVRGMPTNQVNYAQAQHPAGGAPAGVSAAGGLQYARGQVQSQPLTPVGSFVSGGGGSGGGGGVGQFHPSMHSQHHPHPHPHSHPASPRGSHSLDTSSLVSSMGSSGTATGSTGSVASGSGAASAFNSTPNLSPHSSPTMSPHPSPQRGVFRSRSGEGTHPSQQQTQGPQGQAAMQAQQLQQGQMAGGSLTLGVRMLGPPSSGGSLSSSGSNTPTSQVGPGFASVAHAAAGYNYAQQQIQQARQPTQPAHLSLMQIQPGSSPTGRRPLPIQTHHGTFNPYGGPHAQQGPSPLYTAAQHQQTMQQQQQQQLNQQQAQMGHTLAHAHPGPSGGLMIKTSNLGATTAGGGSVPSSTPSAGGSGGASAAAATPGAPVLSGDSPTSKSRFKAFYRDLWALVREDPDAAYEFGKQALGAPAHTKIQWKIAMEMADLSKRQNHIPRARYWYNQAHSLEPQASQVWIEHAKMEEEVGELVKCELLMERGLQYCEWNEALMIKCIKHYERMGDIAAARGILAKLRDVPLERVWRTVLEGGLMEARLGNLATARRVFKFLMAHVSWMGPIYWEAARVEERWGLFDGALAVVEKGLAAVPRYGPLWFMAFRLQERLSEHEPDLPRMHAHRALQHVSAELVWKMHFEVAQMEERLGEFDRARDAYAASIHACPLNLRWKVWLSGARMELLSADAVRVPIARALLARALDEVPKKMRASVWLEQSRMEEFLGDLPRARQILKAAQRDAKSEWKVFLESVLLELRAKNIDAAIAEAEAALEIHNGTGRLWAILIQLKQKQKHELGHRLGHRAGSLKDQWSIFRQAIKEVPKSGEVWCEGARLVLNPYSRRFFHLRLAKRFLNFAIQFTPQYGDSFIEYLRLKMILEGIEETPSLPPPAVSTLYGAADAANAAAGGAVVEPQPSPSPKPSLEPGMSHFRRVAQLCVNAEPNYGSSWFACKRAAHWAPVEVLDVARGMIERHLVLNQRQYQTAILAGWYRPASAAPTPGQPADPPQHPATTDLAIPPTALDNEGKSLQQRLDEAAAAGSHDPPGVVASLAAEIVPAEDSPTATGGSRSHSSSPRSSSSVSLATGSGDESNTGEELAPSSQDEPLETEPIVEANSEANAKEDESTSEDTAPVNGMFSPRTWRRAQAIEAGVSGLLSPSGSTASMASRATPDSTDTCFLTSEDDEDDLQAEYLPDAEFNSLQILYPPIANLSVQERHRCLYGADPITP